MPLLGLAVRGLSALNSAPPCSQLFWLGARGLTALWVNRRVRCRRDDPIYFLSFYFRKFYESFVSSRGKPLPELRRILAPGSLSELGSLPVEDLIRVVH